jgi:hypothetical protein
MNKCKKCQSDIPNWIKINEKLYNISSRKFCLKCSPHKTHNTKNLKFVDYNPVFVEKDSKKYKLCPSCEKYLEINSTNYYITKSGKFYNYCKSCGKKKTLEQQTKRKHQSIEYKGGKCKVCGYNKYYGALEFHHLNPNEKDFGISAARSFNFEKIKKELDKCVLVCSNCHREIHSGITTV